MYRALTLHQAFGGPDSLRGNTGPFWVGSGEFPLSRVFACILPSGYIDDILGLAILSAIVVFLFVKPLTTDGMIQEDEEVSVNFLYGQASLNF